MIPILSRLTRYFAVRPFVTVAIVFFGVVIPAYVVASGLSSVLVWAATLAGVIGCCARMTRDYERPERIYYVRLGIFAFAAVSVLGSIMVFDNIVNFGEPFYSLHDDSDYFYTIQALATGEAVEVEEWLFEYVFAGFYKVVNLFKPASEVHFLDMLTISWGFAAISVVLIVDTVRRLTKVRMPFWLVGVVLLANHVFMKTSVLFYREAFLMCFVFLAMRAVIARENAKALWYLGITFFIRGFNAILVGAYQLVNHVMRIWPKPRLTEAYALTTIAILIVAAGSLRYANQSANVLVALGKPVYASARYLDVWEGATIEEYISARHYNTIGQERSAENKLRSGLPGPAKLGVDLVSYLFFPIAFHPPITSREHNSVDKDMYVEEGVFLFNVVEWLSVLCWIVTIPLLLLGLWRARHGDIQLRNLLGLYVVAAAIITVFHAHQRHAVFLLALNPVFVTVGYTYYVKGGRYLPYQLLQVVVTVGIIGYNIVKYW